MNSDEIDRFLRDRLRDFDGVFSDDILPEDFRLVVCNTNPYDKVGRHWIVIHVDEDGRGDFSTRLDVGLMSILNTIHTACRGTLTLNSSRV